MAKLLLMEGDDLLGFELRRNLEKTDHEVEVRGLALLACEELLFNAYDVLITDVVGKENGRSVVDGGIALIGRMRVARTVVLLSRSRA